ncbi:hypothetical protein ACH5RR_005229 [Cinchona calisaya]|uniref:Rho termination factor-like N-terminal domain-containing protein n=1 Tax=Cinchona calisaya TaxID=153742 RepID=A0ABD3AKT5_9GENT
MAMDSSLWDPPIYEDDSSDFGGNWLADFYFDLGRDVIEEDAINQRCCIQVLNTLRPKADTEIEELEQEIILLQGQLAWADEVWSKTCSNTLIERINSLNLLIQRLKNEKLQKEHELDFDFDFQAHGDHAQNEIVQMEHEVNIDLQTTGDPTKNEKPKMEHELDFCFQTHGEPSQKEKLGTKHEQDFCFQMHEEPAQNEKLQTEHELNFSLQTHGDPAPKLTEIIETLPKKYSPKRDEQNSSSNTEKLATCQSKDEIKFKALACVAKTLEETVEQLCLEAPKVDEKEKDQIGDTTTPDLITLFYEHVNEVSSKRKMNEVNSSTEIGQGAGISDPTSKAEKRMRATQIEKEAYAVMINTSANTLRYESGSISGKRGCNQSEETCGGVIVQSLKIESTNLKSSPKHKKTTIAESDLLADMASVCMLDPVNQIAEESISKQKLKMLADADRTSSIDTPQQWARTRRMTTEFPQTMKQEESWLSDSERTIGESFLELLNIKRKEAKKPPIKERQKPKLLKRNLMSRVDENFVNKRIKEETHPDFSGEKSFRVALDVSACQPLRKRKKSTTPPLIKRNEKLSLQVIQKMHDGQMNAYVDEEDEPISNIHAAKDTCDKPLLTPCATMDLKALTMAQLRAMAKARKLTKYSKLNKSDLIKLLEQ